MKKKAIISFMIICSMALSVLIMPEMSKVNAAGYDSLEEYVKTQSYLGDGSEVYYGDLKIKKYEPYLEPNNNNMKGNIGYYIADFDSDGDNELLTLSLNEDYNCVISVSELDNGNIVVKDTRVVEDIFLNDYNYYIGWNEDGFSSFNCFIYPKNGRMYIAVEVDYEPVNANHVGYSLATFLYGEDRLDLQYTDAFYQLSDHVEEYDEDYDFRKSLDNNLAKGGFDFTYDKLLYSDINTNYSDFIEGSQKICGIRQRSNYFEYPYYLDYCTIKDYSKITFYNLGNPNPTSDGTMYRVYNTNSGEHFYTSNNYEKSYLISSSWDFEGVAWKAPTTSDIPVYRLYSPGSGDHHYTKDEGEKNMLVIAGWNDEGVGFYSSESGTPLYRLYNPNATGAGSHHYTTSTTERDGLVSAGWRDEGIGWYGV